MLTKGNTNWIDFYLWNWACAMAHNTTATTECNHSKSLSVQFFLSK